MKSNEILPLWPSRGNRRRLEERWLAELERSGLALYLAAPPRVAPGELRSGIEEFNDGSYWDCHETLEAVWLNTPYPLRFFYHSIIKAAVGLYHISRRNRHGARVKLADSVRLLRLFPPEYMGVRTGLLLEDVDRWLARVDADGPVDWQGMDALARPIIRTAEPLDLASHV